VAVWAETPPERSFTQLAHTLPEVFHEDCERIAVFNGPSTASPVPHQHRLDRYAFLSENAGVARAWNIGWQLSLADVLCFINEDVIAAPGALAPLLAALDRDPLLGAVGPVGAMWDTARMTHNRAVTANAADPVVRCDAIAGFAIAIRRNALRSAGGFDERFSPAGGEEIDLCLTLRRDGWDVATVHCEGIEHTWGISARSRRTQIEWIGGRESLIDIDSRTRELLRRKWSQPAAGARAGPDVSTPRSSTAGRFLARARWLVRSVRWRLRSYLPEEHHDDK
jgi:GT2 family glycosyltransferase